MVYQIIMSNLSNGVAACVNALQKWCHVSEGMRWIASFHVAEVQGGRGCYGDGEDGGGEGREKTARPAPIANKVVACG